MRKLLCLITLLCTGCLCLCLTACKIETKNQGECGFRYGTEFTFFSRSAKTADESATIESSSQPLMDYLHKPPALGPTPVIAPVAPGVPHP